MFKIVEEVVKVDDFLRLRKSSGLSPRPRDAAMRALPNSLYGVHILLGGTPAKRGRGKTVKALNGQTPAVNVVVMSGSSLVSKTRQLFRRYSLMSTLRFLVFRVSADVLGGVIG